MKKIFVLLVLVNILLNGCDNKVVYPLAQVSDGTNGNVNALAVFNGNLIAGGSFTNAGNISASNIAQWNGSTWSAMASGLNNSVCSLIVFNGNLIAGCPNSGIFQWNGTKWTQLVVGKSNNYLFTIYNNNLVVGGGFDSIGGIKAANLAQWNGSVWSQIDTGSNDGFSSLATYNGALVVAGSSLMMEGKSYNFIAKWNGVSWATLGTGIIYESDPVLFVNDTNIYMGGVSGFSILIDSNWNSVTVAANTMYTSNNITDFCLYNGNTLAVLYSSTLGPNTVGSSIIKCGETSFSYFESPLESVNGGINAMIQYQNNLIVGGGFSEVGNTSVLNIAQYNGTTWSPL